MLNNFRIISLIEGLSFLVLLFIAMPLKYHWGHPEAVSMVGMTHGLLFIAYVAFASMLFRGRNSLSFIGNIKART